MAPTTVERRASGVIDFDLLERWGPENPFWKISDGENLGLLKKARRGEGGGGRDCPPFRGVDRGEEISLEFQGAGGGLDGSAGGIWAGWIDFDSRPEQGGVLVEGIKDLRLR